MSLKISITKNGNEVSHTLTAASEAAVDEVYGTDPASVLQVLLTGASVAVMSIKRSNIKAAKDAEAVAEIEKLEPLS